MDVRGRVTGVLRAARARYAAGAIDMATMKAIAARGNRLVSRSGFLRAAPDAVPRLDAENLSTLDRLAGAMAAGGRVVAIDVGANHERLFDEIGIATWTPAGIDTVNLVDRTALYRLPDPTERVPKDPSQAYRPSLFGPTLVMDAPGMIETARLAVEAADLVVFHSAGSDLPRLGFKIPPDRIVDTQRCGWIWAGRSPSLARLCERYGIDCSGAHNSANDAHYTLRVAIAMTRDGTRAGLRARDALRAARDEARRRLVMLPTRSPDHKACWRAWEEARLRADAYRIDPEGPSLPPVAGHRPRYAEMPQELWPPGATRRGRPDRGPVAAEGRRGPRAPAARPSSGSPPRPATTARAPDP